MPRLGTPAHSWPSLWHQKKRKSRRAEAYLTVEHDWTITVEQRIPARGLSLKAAGVAVIAANKYTLRGTYRGSVLRKIHYKKKVCK